MLKENIKMITHQKCGCNVLFVIVITFWYFNKGSSEDTQNFNSYVYIQVQLAKSSSTIQLVDEQ